MGNVNDDLWFQLTETEKADLLATYAARNPATATATHLVIESFADIVAADLPPQRFLVDGLIPAGQLVMLGGGVRRASLGWFFNSSPPLTGARLSSAGAQRPAEFCTWRWKMAGGA